MNICRRSAAVLSIVATLAPAFCNAQTLTATHVHLGAAAADAGERHTFQFTVVNDGAQDLSNIVLTPAPVASVVPYDIKSIEIPFLSAGASVAVNWTITLATDAYVPELLATRSFAGTAQLSDGATTIIALDSTPDATQP